MITRRRLLGFAVLGTMIGLAVYRAQQPPPGPPPDPARTRVWNKVETRLHEARKEIGDVEDRHLQRINDFFAEKKQNVRAFAEATPGWGSKWQFLKGKLFGDDGRGHREYLRRAFEDHLFSDRELRDLLHATVTAHLTELEGHENTFLVAIRADLSDQDLPDLRALAAAGDEAAFRDAYKKLLDKAIPVIGRDLGIAVGREVVVWVASDVAASVIVRLGVSGGILGTGAASGLATLGVGVLMTVIIDWAVDWILQQLGHDPAGEIERQTRGMLDRLRDALVEGDKEARESYAKLRKMQEHDPVFFVRPEAKAAADQIDAAGVLGLRHEMSRLRQLRERAREAALRRLVYEGGAP